MTDSVKSAAEAELLSLQDPNLTFVYSSEVQAYTEGAEFGASWQREQDESEAMKVATQRAVKIAELGAEVAELTEALTATHRSGERDLQKMESAWGELAALKAKLTEVRRLAEADKRCPCCSGYGHILAILDGEADDH